MKALRKAIFWLHLAVGIVVGVVILSMATTGTILAFQRQITDWAERGFRVTAAPGSVAMPPEALLAKAREAVPEPAPSGLSMRSDPAAPATISIGREAVLLVNPYSGQALGVGASGVRGFFRWVTEWHRWFAREGASKEVGKAITGACSVGFLGLVLSGIYLWWPRRWSKTALMGVSVPSLTLRGKARDFNWHNAAGLWCAPLLLVITLTGVIMSYPWANDLLFRITGNEPPPPRKEGAESGSGSGAGQQAGRQRPGEGHRGDADSLRNADGGKRKGEHRDGAAGPAWAGLDPLWLRAQQQVAGWKTLSVRFTPGPRGAVTFTIDQGDGGRPDLRSQLTLNPKTGDIVKWEPFSSYNAGRRLRMWARFAHTGEAGGWIGQTLAACAACGAILLVWTGFALAWRRFARYVAGRRAKTGSPAILPSTEEAPLYPGKTQFADRE